MLKDALISVLPQVYVMYEVPTLSLNVNSSSDDDGAETTRNAIYASGNGTSELIFAYTVEPGDSADRLDYSAPAADALDAPFGTIVEKDTFGPVYLRSLPGPGEEGSLGWNTNIEISDDVLLVEQVTAATGQSDSSAGVPHGRLSRFVWRPERNCLVHVVMHEASLALATPLVAAPKDLFARLRLSLRAKLLLA